MQFFLLRILYDLYFNTRYIISFIDRVFLLKIYSNAKIKRISILIIVKNIENRKYNISEYIKLKIYLLDKNEIVVIERKLHIVDNLIAKALIDINVIKLERIVIDLENNLIKIDEY